MIDPSLRRALPARSVAVLRGLVLMACLAVLGACATSPQGSPGGEDPMAALERRVAERWQFVIDNDLHGAYQYLTPGYRGTYSVQDYVSRTRSVITFTSASWQGADCSGDDSCLVDVRVGYRVRMPSAGDVPSINHHQERWIRTGGEWYFLPPQ